MAGETSDAISACTHVKMTEAPRLLRLPKEECPEIWTRIPPRQRPESSNNIDDLVVRFQRNFCGHPQAGLLWEKKNEELLFEKGCGKVPTWECLYAHKKALIILIETCGCYKIGWKEAEHALHVKILQKDVDLEDPTP